jgi:type IV secretory pathway VirB10-like protein
MQKFKIQNSKCKVQSSTLVRAGLFAFCILHLALLSACAKAKAAVLVPDGPPLAMSVPPPRVITPVEEVAVAEPPPAPVPEPPAAAPARPAARPPAPANPKPEPPAPVTAPPTTPAVTTSEPRQVSSVPSAAAAAEERKVREVMTRASRDLARVDYQKLSAEGREQYAQSKRFTEQAEQALKEKNFIYAMQLATNAATLAGELAGR